MSCQEKGRKRGGQQRRQKKGRVKNRAVTSPVASDWRTLGLRKLCTLAIPAALAQVSKTSQDAQKCSKRVREVFSGLPSKSPKPDSCTVQQPVLGTFPWCDTRFAPVRKTLSRHQSTFGTLLVHFWACGHAACAAPVLFVCLEAQKKSHRKIAVTTVAASGLTTILLQKSQVFALHQPQKNR